MKWMLVLLLSFPAFGRVYEVKPKNKVDFKKSITQLGGKIVKESRDKMVIDINNRELFGLRKKHQKVKFSAIKSPKTVVKK